MLYVNESLQISNRVIKDRGTGKVFSIDQICMGNPENGRAIILTVPKTLRKIQKGMNPSVTIGYTETYRPRIHEAVSEEIYLLLTSKGVNQEGSNSVQVAESYRNSINVLKKGFEYEILNPQKAHSWSNMLCRFSGKTGILRIHTDDEKEDQVLLVTGSQVIKCTEKTLGSVCRFKKIKLTGNPKWINL